MSKLSGGVKGAATLMGRLGKIENILFPVVAEQLALAAITVHREAVKSIAEHRSTGMRVRRYPLQGKGRKRWVDVSAPGAPPNQDLGTLTRSIKFEIDTKKLTAVVGTNLKYGLYLERGTRRMEARPWLGPAFNRSRESAFMNIFQAMKRTIGKKGA